MNDLLKQLKEYWFLIVVVWAGAIGIVKVLGNNYVIEVSDANLKSDSARQYITTIIADELDDAKTIAELHGSLKTHEAKIDGNAGDIKLTQEQLQDVARILMQPPD